MAAKLSSPVNAVGLKLSSSNQFSSGLLWAVKQPLTAWKASNDPKEYKGKYQMEREQQKKSINRKKKKMLSQQTSTSKLNSPLKKKGEEEESPLWSAAVKVSAIEAKDLPKVW